MKNYFLFLYFSLCVSCFNKSDSSVVTVDLDKTVSHIPYSSFVDSLNYITFNVPEHLILSEVIRLYIDGDNLFVQDKNSGLLVFSLEKRSLIKAINYFGDGPEEFGNIRAFTFNADQKQLLIYSYPYLYKYTYDGEFIERISNTEMNLVDLYCTNAGEYICIAPEDVGPDAPHGVWLTDSAFQFIEILKEIPPKQMLFTRSTFYNRTEHGIYYYDRVWDDFSFITTDSVDIMYAFDLKQRVPADMRQRENPFDKLIEYSSIGEFSNSDRYILLNYFQFNGDLTWVLFDKTKNEIISSRHLLNDMSGVEISSVKLFYIDNQTWCRVLDLGEDETSITFEFMSIKS